MHNRPDSKWQKKVDRYTGLLLQELAAIVDESIAFTWEGLECCYVLRILKQPNGYMDSRGIIEKDCGIYVIKWMEMWDPNNMVEDESNIPI
ncbi:hypothetical protein HN873_021461 [Arachis hypogaea]